MVAEIETDCPEVDAELDKRNVRQGGTVSQSSIEYLTREIPAERVTKRLREMLDAKTPQGNPDWRARESAVKLWLSYVIGLPVQRQEIIQKRINETPSLNELLSTPGAAETILAALAPTPETKGKLLDLLKSSQVVDAVAVEPVKG